jgi:hypothetical protein
VRRVAYWSANGTTVIREYQADEITVVDGIVLPGRMTMVDKIRNHTTAIYLERAWYDRPVAAEVFDPSFRKHTRDYLAAL